MKKITVLFIAVLTTMTSFGQENHFDSIPKIIDTVLIFEKSDTIPCLIFYAVKDNQVRYEDGFIVLRGYKKNGKGQWINQPKAFLLNRSKKAWVAKRTLKIFY